MMFALSAGLAPAVAQPTPPGAPPPPAAPLPPAAPAADETVVLGEFVVSEVRASLIGAQEIKQNSFQFVDSIVAQDIGKLPDNSVADALQRISGIQVGRGNGEVGVVLVRGLPNLGTTVNGHEIFTGTSRGVALQDIPAELIAGVDVFKTSTPEQVEGGIAGLIDIRLRRPLDFKGAAFSAGGRGIYGENADKTGYVGSVLLSDRWKTSGGGDFGALYSGSYQQRYFVDQVSFNFLFEPEPTVLVPGQTTVQLPLTQGSQVIPGDRSRFAHNLSLQFRPNSEWEIYTDFLYTGYRDEHQVHFLIGFPRFGTLTSVSVLPGTNIPTTTTSTNNFHLTSTQAFQQETDGYQTVVGAKWQRGPVKITTDVLYNKSTYKNEVLILDTQYAPPTPATFTFIYNDDGMANMRVTNGDVTNGDHYYLWGLFDNHDISTSDQKAWKADLEYSLGDGFLTSIKTGVRLTDREVEFQGTSRNDIAPAGGRGLVPTSSIPGFGSVNPQGVFDDYGVPYWYGASPDFLYSNADRVRSLFGLPAGEAPFNPTLAFTDDENTYAAYVQAHYRATLGDMPLDGLLGVRIVQTDQTLIGYRQDGSPLNESKDQVDVLPVLNARLKLQENLLLRLSAGRTITRPNFADLNPAATLNAPTTTGGGAGSGSGGNPDLESVKSDNFDLGLEYYFEKASYVSVTGFRRNIEGYVQSFAATEMIGSTPYIVTRPRNSGEGHLQGIEVSYQHFPEFFPSMLKGLGWQTNFTYIDGETDTADTSPGAPVGARVTRPYAQVSEKSYNIIGIYERGRFSTRLAYNWRGEFTETFDGPNAPGSPLRQIIVKPTKTLDFSASYRLNDNFTITFDVTNLTDSKYQDYFADASKWARDTRAYDRTFALGVRYKY